MDKLSSELQRLHFLPDQPPAGNQQALGLAFTRAADDIFLASSFLFLSLIVLIWFTKRPASPAGAADAAAGAH